MTKSLLDNAPMTAAVICLQLAKAKTAEPPVSSEHFLWSYLNAGCWLRWLTLDQQVQVLRQQDSSALQKMAACAAMYQQLGLIVEDALVTLVAWSLWSHDKGLNLADIASRISLKSDRSPDPYNAADVDAVRSKVNGTKRIVVDARRYLHSIVQGCSIKELPALFGVRWRPTPSVKLVPKDEQAAWQSLPDLTYECVSNLASRHDEIITICLNKLKHGPQLVLDNPHRTAELRSIPFETISGAPDRVLLRLLMDGPRTEQTAEEWARRDFVAPYILDDANNAQRILRYTAGGILMRVHEIGYWLFRSSFPDSDFQIGMDDRVQQLRDEILGIA